MAPRSPRRYHPTISTQYTQTCLGLDWDDTITDNPDAFALLAQQFDRVHIITLNHGVTPELAEEVLGCRVASVAHSPDERVIAGESHIWKAEVCERLGVDLVLDDDPDVVR